MAKKPSKPQINLTEDVLLPYVIELGTLLFYWNNLHAFLQLIFLTVMDDPKIERRKKALIAAWNAVPNDRMQRNMLRQAAKARFSPFSDETPEAKKLNENMGAILNGLDWLLKKADAVGRQRDDAAHVPIGFTHNAERGTHIVPMGALEHPIAAQFEGKELTDEFQLSRLRIEVLTTYAGDLWRHMLGHIPLPYIPQWPTSLHPSADKAGKAQSRPKRRSRPPRSSRA
jgi:hypothetical protein